MAADDGELEAFKARLPLAEIVARYVPLRRRGRELWGCCPFHSEKTPSFHVVEDRGFYHCFGCGAHGNAIDFVMAVEGLDFPTALQRLSELTGIPAPRGRRAATPPPVDERLYEANAAAQGQFTAWLRAGAGRGAREYLRRRGVSPELAAEFAIGYAPAGRDGLVQALTGRGFDRDLLVRAGLAARDEATGEVYDRFRDRLMFPIHDARGRVVGFGGRALGEARAKYLNTPETELFRKGELLFNLHRARTAARRTGELFVVEGYMDVVALAGIGLQQVVAPLGTAIGEAQLELAWRLADEPLLCLDGDAAGRAAALRAAERALPRLRPGRSLRFVFLPEGEDPDSLVRRMGAEAAARLREAPVALSDLLWRAEIGRTPPDTPERRAMLARRIRERVRAIEDAAVRDQYAREWFGRLAALQPAGGGRRGRRREPAPAATDPARLRAEMAGFERETALRLLLPVLRDPGLLRYHEEAFAAVELDHPEGERLRREILAWYAESASLDPVELRNHLSAHGFDGLIEGMLADARGTQPDDGGPESWTSVLERLERIAAKRREAREIAEMLRNRDTDAVSPRLASLGRLLGARDPGGDPPAGS